MPHHVTFMRIFVSRMYLIHVKGTSWETRSIGNYIVQLDQWKNKSQFTQFSDNSTRLYERKEPIYAPKPKLCNWLKTPCWHHRQEFFPVLVCCLGMHSSAQQNSEMPSFIDSHTSHFWDCHHFVLAIRKPDRMKNARKSITMFNKTAI